MNLIEQIKDLKSKQRLIELRIEEIENVRERLMHPGGLDYTKDPVKSSPQDQLAKNIADLVDKQIELSRTMIDQQKQLDALMDELNKLDPEEREVMFLRMKGLSYRKIADDVYRCSTTVYNIVKRIEERYGQQIQ